MIFDEFTLKSQIRAVPDFPKPGVVFRDITPLFQSPRALRMTVDSFVQRYIEADFSHIGAMDARGFLIGSAVAYALNKPLVLFRRRSSTCRNSAAPLACRTPASPPSVSPRSLSTSVDTPGRALAPRVRSLRPIFRLVEPTWPLMTSKWPEMTSRCWTILQ